MHVRNHLLGATRVLPAFVDGFQKLKVVRRVNGLDGSRIVSFRRDNVVPRPMQSLQKNLSTLRGFRAGFDYAVLQEEFWM